MEVKNTVGSSPIGSLPLKIQSFSTSMMMGERVFGFFETVCSIRKGLCTSESHHTLKSKPTTQNQRVRAKSSSSGCNLKNTYVPSLPTHRISQFRYHHLLEFPKIFSWHSGFDQPLNKKNIPGLLFQYFLKKVPKYLHISKKNTLMLLNM